MRVLVVGLGSMGRRRLRNLSHIGGHELAGLEPQDERRAEVAAEFGVESFADLNAALAWRPDAMVISTPPDLHARFALAAAEHGIHFFHEASVVSSGMNDVIEAVRGKPLVAAPSATMRFHPACQKLRERIDAGAIGPVRAVVHHVGQYLPDWHPWEDYRTFYVAQRETGAAREIVPFELNWLTGLFGRVTHATGFRGRLSSLDVDIDDLYAALVEFESGVHASMVVEVISRPAIRRARLIGDEGTLEWDWNDRTVREYRAADSSWVEFPDPPAVAGPGGEWVAENMYIEEMRCFLDAVANGPERWPFTLEDDHALLTVVEQVENGSDAVFAD